MSDEVEQPLEDFSEYEQADPGYYLAINSADKAIRASNKLIIAERRAKVAKLIHSRVPQYRIAEILQVSRETVKMDAAWLREQWRDEALEDIDEQFKRELEELSVWEAKLSEWALKTKNSNYIEKILRIKEMRARMLGLYKPAKVALTTPDGSKAYSAMSEHELDAKIAELQGQIASVDNE
jgi:predicted transcriptional regulator